MSEKRNHDLARGSMSRDLAVRFVLVATVTVAIVLIATWVLYARVASEVQAQVLEDAAKHYQARLGEINHDWLIEADKFRSEIEFNHLAEGADTSYPRLTALLASYGGQQLFTHVTIVDRNDNAVYQYQTRSTQNLQIPPAGTLMRYVYGEQDDDLFQVIEQPLWMGAPGKGRLILYVPLDNTFLNTINYPGNVLVLRWRGKATAVSGNLAGQQADATIEQAEREHAYREISLDGSANAPQLGILRKYVFPLTLNSSIGLALSGLLIAIVLGFVILGRRENDLIRRLEALAGAANVFGGEHQVNGEVRGYLERSEREHQDELTELGQHLEVMMRSVQKGEEALRASEVRFRSLIENSNDAISLIDEKGVVTYSTPASARILGYTPEEMVGRNAAEFVHPEELPVLQRAMEKTLSVPRSVAELKVRARHKAGEWRIGEGTFTNLLDHPDVRAIIANYRDVTERERTQTELRKSETKFEIAFRASPLPMSISTLAEGRFVDANDAMLRLLECGREEIIGRTTKDLQVVHSPADRAAAIRELKELGSLTAMAMKVRTMRGRILHVELSAGLIDLDAEPCALTVMFDMTEKRSLEQQLRQAQKMEAVGQLAGGVAHDFNNLVMVINGCAELVKEAAKDNAKIVRLAEQIHSAGNKAALVTKQLLAFSRKQPQDLRVLDLNEVVSEFCKMLPRLLREDIELRVRPLAASALVYTDPGQIEQVIMNLVVNARDAMPNGGKLAVETSNVDIKKDHAILHEAKMRPEKYVMLAVSDTGVGMDAETQTRIFEPFFTTKEPGKGTGLGLATVYGIVKQNNGFLWVYSEVGIGTTFKMYLPRARAEKKDDIAAPRELPNISGGSETVLVVEDQEALRKLLAEYLSAQGYRVLESETGAAAQQLCEAHHEPIHLILTDVVMPGMSGPDLVRAALKTHPEACVIFMSGYSEGALDDVDIKTRSASLQKPFSLQTVALTMRKVLDRKRNSA